MYNKAYIEILNYCNLDCSFCPKTVRKARAMTVEEFRAVIREVTPITKYVYLHVVGEPTLHKDLKEIFLAAKEYGALVTVTTNGTRLPYLYECFSDSPIYKTNVSLTMTGGNENVDIKTYIGSVADFCVKAADLGVYTVMRLWNNGGNDAKNGEIISLLKERFGNFTFKPVGSVTLAKNIYLEGGDKFSWTGKEKSQGFCMGLKDQFAVLSDGTVTPCCIDNNGEIPLGNIFVTPLKDILSSKRAVNIREGFKTRTLVEERCKKCGFTERFEK